LLLLRRLLLLLLLLPPQSRWGMQTTMDTGDVPIRC
jgi:hypothetical protein